MIIEQIHIASFGKLKNLDWELSSGMNLLVGPNESGKSTVAAFIRYMLYGFSGKKTGALSQRKHFVSWEGGKAEGYMVISVEEGRFRIERSTEETETGRYRESSQIINLETGSPEYARSAPGEVFLGVPEEVFLDSAFMGQLEGSSVDGGKMKGAVENILFSGDEKLNTEKAILRLDEARRTLMHKSGKGGLLVELTKKRDALKEELVEVDRLKDGLLEKEAMLKDTQEHKEESIREEQKFKKLEQDLRNALLIRDYDYLHSIEEEHRVLQEKLKAYENEHSVEGFFPTHEYLTELAVSRRGTKDAFRNFTQSTIQLETVKNGNVSEEAEQWIPTVDSIGGAEVIKSAYKEHRKKGMGFGVLTGALFALGLALLVLGLAVFLPKTLLVPMILCVGFGVASLIGGLIVLSYCRSHLSDAQSIVKKFEVTGEETLSALLDRVERARAHREAREEACTVAEESHSESDERYRNAVRELEYLASKWGKTLPQKSEDRDSMLDEIQKEGAAFIAEQSRMKSGLLSMEASIREMRRQLGDKNEVLVRATVAPEDREKLTNLNHQDLVEGIKRCSMQVQFYDSKQRELEKQLIEYRARVADPAAISEQIEVLDRKIEEVEKRYRAYVLAISSIEEAGMHLRREISPRLRSYADGLLRDATDGKYPSLGVSDDLAVSVNDGEKTHSVEYLSAGTQDITYLSLRMALVDLLYKEPPPLLLDETLGRQDEERARGMLRIFKKLTEENRQCLLFTCHKREVELAKEVMDTKIFSLGELAPEEREG